MCSCHHSLPSCSCYLFIFVASSTKLKPKSISMSLFIQFISISGNWLSFWGQFEVAHGIKSFCYWIRQLILHNLNKWWWWNQCNHSLKIERKTSIDFHWIKINNASIVIFTKPTSADGIFQIFAYNQNQTSKLPIKSLSNNH